jgi:general secretion pathway protein M
MNAGASSTFSTALQRGKAAWTALPARERLLLGSAFAVLVLAMLWWVGLAPALDALHNTESRHRSLDAQLQTMRALAAEVGSLQALPRIKTDDSLKALDLAVKQRLGATAQLTVVGERATVNLKGASAEALTQWLAQARSNARALPTEAHLSLNAARTGWDGSVVLALPPR